MVDDTVVALFHVEVLEHVDLIIIVAPVGIDELVVVGLAQVEYATQLAVDILDDGHIRLHIDVDARTLKDGFEGGISEAGAIVPHVVATVAHQHGLVADIGLLGEERVVEAVLTIKNLVGFQLERAIALAAGPSARYTDIDILVEQHFAIATDI